MRLIATQNLQLQALFPSIDNFSNSNELEAVNLSRGSILQVVDIGGTKVLRVHAHCMTHQPEKHNIVLRWPDDGDARRSLVVCEDATMHLVQCMIQGRDLEWNAPASPPTANLIFQEVINLEDYADDAILPQPGICWQQNVGRAKLVKLETLTHEGEAVYEIRIRQVESNRLFVVLTSDLNAFRKAAIH